MDIRAIEAFFRARGVAAWLVGGTARDLVLGYRPHDLDIAVAGDGLVLARALADDLSGSFVTLDDQRATGRVVVRLEADRSPFTIDIAQLRADSIDADLALRDFTINALALPLADMTLASSAADYAWIDPTGGLNDLQTKTLRLAGETSLRDDPLRIVRAARLGAQFDLQPSAELAAQVRQSLPSLERVAIERVRDEFLKLLDTDLATPWLRRLDSWGVLTKLLPELEPSRHCDQPRVHFLPVLAHMLETVAVIEWITAERPVKQADLPVALQHYPQLQRELPFADEYRRLLNIPMGGGYRRLALLKFAALIHDNAKPQTKEVYPDGKVSFYGHQDIGAEVASQMLKVLRLSRSERSYITTVVREHMRPGQLRASQVITMRAVARFFRDLGESGADVLLHELADHMATRGPHIRPEHWQAHLGWIAAMLDTYWGEPEVEREPLLRGTDLMQELGMKPGPLLGKLLHELAEAQAAGEVKDREEALQLARQLLEAEQES